tara:strand:+ start:27 stop:260 length:234 start_codon:yes stop_codon:yes gene_type:complete
MNAETKQKCLKCGKPKSLIGIGRKNGIKINTIDGKDFLNRLYHKKCFIKIKEQAAYMEMMSYYEEDSDSDGDYNLNI